MRRARRRDTACELAIRSALHKRGWRFRIDWKVPQTRRRADIAFVSRRVLVFVDGCFWHVCPIHATWPKANAEWWREKLTANQLRDRDTDSRLRKAGWTVLRFWEHEHPQTAATKIVDVLERVDTSTATVARTKAGTTGREVSTRANRPGLS